MNVLKAAVCSALLTWSAAAQAQEPYPNRPIKLIVPVAAGSVTDVIMRVATQKLSLRLKQQFVIENRTGGNFIIAAQACASAAPDGYTLCAVNNNSLSINPLTYRTLPYDAQKDFVPVVNMFLLVEGLAVPSDLGVNTVAELHKLAIDKPQTLNFATLGAGSYPDLFLSWLNRKWGTKVVGIPYRGGGPVSSAVMAGEVQIASMGLGNFISGIEAGKVKVLALSTATRWPLMAGIETYGEAGIGDFPGHVWWGLVAPNGTPYSIIARINMEFVELFHDPEFGAFLQAQGVQSAVGTPEAFAEFLRGDLEASSILVKLANAKKVEYKEGQ
jgi:tripartite-type tricarboxylate transporter receptor subunit TctC